MTELIRFTDGFIDWPIIDKELYDLQAAAEGRVQDLPETAKAIAAFQEEDGAFSICRDKDMPSDARVDLIHRPTCLCTAALIRAAQNDPVTRESLRPVLKKALEACAAFGFVGHGYDAEAYMEEMIQVFRDSGCAQYLKREPTLCPGFARLWKELDGQIIFVYGTLMRGEFNHHYMKDAYFLGEGTVPGFRKAQRNGLPVAVEDESDEIHGEYYRVGDRLLKRLDELEGEGVLYRRAEATIHTKGSFSTVKGMMYVPVSDHGRLVWYVAYGSNLMMERFRYYIEGGLCPYNNKLYKGCADRRLPRESRAVIIPYEMYFGNTSGTWDGHGVAFIDANTPGQTEGRAYLVTEGQLERIQKQEGSSSEWYGFKLQLPDIEGRAAYTLTSVYRHEDNAPSPDYLKIIEEGRRETEALPNGYQDLGPNQRPIRKGV